MLMVNLMKVRKNCNWFVASYKSKKLQKLSSIARNQDALVKECRKTRKLNIKKYFVYQDFQTFTTE